MFIYLIIAILRYKDWTIYLKKYKKIKVWPTMWNEKSRRERDPVIEQLEPVVNGYDDADTILHIQEILMQQTQHYVSLTKRPEISDLPALEAICFLAVVNDQIGLDIELLENCITLLGVSRNKLFSTIEILKRFHGVVAGDLYEFIVVFSQYLHQKLETNPGVEIFNANS